MSELKPCPFCGAKGRTLKHVSPGQLGRFDDDTGQTAIVCDCNDYGCGAMGGFRNSSQEAEESWNTRTPASAEVEKLITKLLLAYEKFLFPYMLDDQHRFAKQYSEARKELLTALTTPATLAKPSREDWIKASDRMPETGKKVFAFYLNEIGKPRKIMAFYTPRFTMEQDEDPNEATEYCEDKDAYYLKEGWYEDNEFDECHWKVDGKITHWMPLPESPKEDR